MHVSARKSARVLSRPSTALLPLPGGQIQVEATHFRKFELEQIAKDVKAEIVFMKPVDDEHKKKK